MPLLELRDLQVRYGGIIALDGVSLEVAKGEIVCLIGANGAGKSTVLNSVSGVVPVVSGTIEFGGLTLRGTRASGIVRKGLVQVPEGRLVFPDMSVIENLEMGAYSRRASFEEALVFVFSLFPRLQERRSQLAGLMSGGEQQMLAIGRALMAKPSLLLLDEPSMGLAPRVIVDIFRTLKRLRAEFGLSIMLVEQNARAALALADRGYVLTNGKITARGTSAELLADHSVLEAFLGRLKAKGVKAPASKSSRSPSACDPPSQGEKP
jgi:branched-chain amino acid transport system ATP-binding protein